MNGKWFLKSIQYEYTNEYIRAGVGDTAYVMSEYFEWLSHGFTKYINEDLIDKFYFELDFSTVSDEYDEQKWKWKLPEFYHASKDSVYYDLERAISMEDQFIKNGIVK